MRFPTRMTAAGRRALAAVYADTARVYRSMERGSCTEDREIYADIPCHLSVGNKGAPHRQGETGSVASAYTLHLSVCHRIQLGDALVVSHNGITYKGTAGLPVRGNLSVIVPMDGVQLA